MSHMPVGVNTFKTVTALQLLCRVKGRCFLSLWDAFTLVGVDQLSQMRSSCSTCHTESQQTEMETSNTHFVWLTLISVSLLLKCEARSDSKPFQATSHNSMLLCRDGFMSVNISKAEFADLPFNVYVQGKSDYWSMSHPHYSGVLVFLQWFCLCSLFTHRWTRRILPGHFNSKTVPLLLWRKWNLYGFYSCSS